MKIFKLMATVCVLGILIISAGCGNDASSANPSQNLDNGNPPSSSLPPVVGNAMTFATAARTFNFGGGNMQLSGKLGWTFEKNKFDQGYYSSQYSNIVVTKDTVYVSLAGQSGNKVQGLKNGTLFALDYQTGKEKWSVPDNFSKIIATDDTMIGMARPTTYGDPSLNALDANDGKSKWAVNLLPGATYSAPVLSDGMVYIAQYNQQSWSNSSTQSKKDQIIAFNAGDGKEKWRFPVELYLTNATKVDGPIATDGLLYCVGQNDTPFGRFDMIYAVDTNSGQEKWTWEPDNRGNMTAPVFEDGVIYAAAKESFDPSDKDAPKNPMNYLYALDAQSGQEKWNVKTDLDNIFSATVHHGTIYVVQGDKSYSGDFPPTSAQVVAYDASNGREKWRYKSALGKPGPEELPVPVVTDNAVYVTNFQSPKDQRFIDILITGLDPATGAEKTKYKHEYLPPGTVNLAHTQDISVDVVNTYNDGSYFLRELVFYNGMLFAHDGTGKLYGIQ